MRVLPLVFLASFLIGCSNNDVPELTLGPTDANVAGTFNLTTANGAPLPILATRTLTEEFDLTADQMVLDATGTWTETTSYVVIELADGSQSTTTSISSGTFTIDNKQINFLRTVGGPASFTGSVSGNTLNMLYNGGHFIYTK